MVEKDPTRPERLQNAPIVEAIVDLHIDPVVSKLEDLKAFEELALAEFPDRKRVIEWRNDIDLRDEEPKVTAASSEVKGHAFWSADKKRVLQARMNGFSCSHLAPYDRWSTLRDDARSWWGKFAAVTKPKKVSRYALRFVNRMELPLPMKDFADYLRTTPQVAPDLPQGLSGVFMRVVIPFGEATVVITEAIDEAGATAEKVPFILDIDVFQVGDVDPRSDELWSKLETLRTIKNDVFFSSLTPKAWGLFA